MVKVNNTTVAVRAAVLWTVRCHRPAAAAEKFCASSHAAGCACCRAAGCFCQNCQAVCAEDAGGFRKAAAAMNGSSKAVFESCRHHGCTSAALQSTAGLAALQQALLDLTDTVRGGYWTGRTREVTGLERLAGAATLAPGTRCKRCGLHTGVAGIVYNFGIVADQ